ncbi:anaphase-promoting complex subunit 13 isoform X2 [Monomorium pharaonis]|uniref:anaphase-promoting complex subunit 13 isoform X2 n=1 Tax=Monomorium pharaonis TaxID=307658 RepID=UPI00063EFF38|nr:anaphase-promoting complex subunit 13 isoform X2 [Monomorium pharaonis]
MYVFMVLRTSTRYESLESSLPSSAVSVFRLVILQILPILLILKHQINSPELLICQVCGDGRLIDVIDESWRKERLPIDDISTPVAELPDPESDNGDSHMTLKELEQKWNNLALSSLSDNHLHSPTPLHN